MHLFVQARKTYLVKEARINRIHNSNKTKRRPDVASYNLMPQGPEGISLDDLPKELAENIRDRAANTRNFFINETLNQMRKRRRG